jgi:ABC-2 type transport system ATP-binding protein
MIEVEHLTKFYGAYPALRDVTFNVERGEILGFLGPNGAGKTTTMRILTGYIPATSGTVRVAGFDVAEKSMEARAHLGYLPETVPLYTELTTFEYLDFKGRISGMHRSRERRARINEVMEELHLADVSRKLIGTLSRGYRQRVGLAQALLHDPDVLILDEPTVGLDPVQITDVRALIKELGKDRTIILSTHLLPEVSMVCDRVVIINRGRLVALDTPIHLADTAMSAQSVQLEVAGPSEGVLSFLRALPGVVSVQLSAQDGSSAAAGSGSDTQRPAMVGSATGSLYQVEGKPGVELRPALSSAIVGAGYQLLEMKSVRPTLEDIFIRVISQEEEAYAEERSAAIEAGLDPDYVEEITDEEEEVEEEVAAPRVRTQISTKRRARK